MTPIEIGLLGVVLLFVLMFIGVPVGISMGVSGLIGMLLLNGPSAAFLERFLATHGAGPHGDAGAARRGSPGGSASRSAAG